MKQTPKNLLSSLRRPVLFLLCLSIVYGAASGVAFAAANGGQVQYRSIRMSDNGISGSAITTGVGSGANVTYRVSFTAATSYTIKSVVLDFCKGTGGTPFVGDNSCPTPTGFTVGSTPTVDTTTYQSETGLSTSASWSASSVNSGQTFKMTNTAGKALTSGTNYTFAISGITNPSDMGSFYGRLITYTSDTGDIATYSHSAPGSYQDYGGFALSTSNIVQVTAKVPETLTFCMLGTTSPPTLTQPSGCTDITATVPAITLGHGTNNSLDTQNVDSNSVYSFISTNALHGVIIRMHNANSCGGLSNTSGTTCGIPPTNAGAATTPATLSESIQAGTAAFGLAVTSGAGVNASAPYDGDPISNYYGMDSTSTGSNVTTDYGSPVLTSTGPMSNVSNTWTFAATVSNTTPAGIYTANLAAIATGTF